MRKDGTVAVLIDGDNISPRFAARILSEISGLGTVTVRRVYGDWSLPPLSGWAAVLERHALRPVQQFAGATGKKSTDIALVIDAIDIMILRQADAVCIVSSDGDFAPLAVRLRQGGMTVYGAGEEKAPKRFIDACDAFVTLPPPARKAAVDPDPLRGLFGKAFALSDTKGPLLLPVLAANLRKADPSFSCKALGHAKLSGLCESVEWLECSGEKSEMTVMLR